MWQKTDVRRVRVLAALALVAGLAAACVDGPASPDADGVVFLTLSVQPNASMQALFEGRIVLDAQGCLRFDSVEPATVVWPKSFRLERRGDDLVVRDASGREVGRVGGSFRLGGGFVQALHPGFQLSDRDRQLAAQRCPGSYWIVGDVLRVG